ncbi:hypothetical protein GGTG_11207 [Gaeumannomyces tritici R3-111a-1]|uniref:Uncharacterized protein n=1 Tax=Gaeumannomyces tritici (strain R3-111a-1) TaxID=644352 RepID=J3PCI6_GAET3|nr:hypothetical protein GGTG_11207 [Gaeumannomyces tritici R3-111a-1]EJT71956.1 hypothetical protein GGTG_11207 [Gaeumannomyces tritici R3-111a-1]
MIRRCPPAGGGRTCAVTPLNCRKWRCRCRHQPGRCCSSATGPTPGPLSVPHACKEPSAGNDVPRGGPYLMPSPPARRARSTAAALLLHTD